MGLIAKYLHTKLTKVGPLFFLVPKILTNYDNVEFVAFIMFAHPSTF